MQDLFEKFDSIVVFGNYRYGSTVLCDILHNFIESQGVEAWEWNEFLHSNKYLLHTDSDGMVSRSLVADKIPFESDKVSLLDTITPYHLVRSKLTYWQRVRGKNFVIFKITPDDLNRDNAKLIEDMILHDNRVLKIGLNRQDIAGAIVSYLIGDRFNIWNENASTLLKMIEQPVVPVSINSYNLQPIITKIIHHNTWLYFNMRYLHDVVWFEDLRQLNIPIMNLYDFSQSQIAANPIDHATRARRYFTNHDAVLRFARDTQDALQPLIDQVRWAHANPQT